MNYGAFRGQFRQLASPTRALDKAMKRRDAEMAKALGVTVDGLHVLAEAVANGGKLKHTRGMAAVKLDKDGFVVRHPNAVSGHYGGHVITDAGREIVRRAREMGW